MCVMLRLRAAAAAAAIAVARIHGRTVTRRVLYGCCCVLRAYTTAHARFSRPVERDNGIHIVLYCAYVTGKTRTLTNDSNVYLHNNIGAPTRQTPAGKNKGKST